MTVLLLFILHWFLALFCQSFFLHRYSSHGMFKMNKFWEKFFYLLTYLTQGPSFLNPTSYSIMHQRHHAHSDTKKDPHSPHHSKNLWELMISTYKEYKFLLNDYKNIKDPHVTHKSPQWDKLDNFAKTKLSSVLWISIYILIYYFLDVELLYYIFLPLHFLIGPIQGAIVNWCGHKIGYRNFNLKDESKNTLPIDFLLLGELYQNNHHKFSKKINFAYKWYEIDFTYEVSRILHSLNIIEMRKKS